MNQEKKKPTNKDSKSTVEASGINLLSFDGLFQDKSAWRERIASAQKKLRELHQENQATNSPPPEQDNHQDKEVNLAPQDHYPSAHGSQNIAKSMSQLHEHLSHFKKGISIMADFLQKEKEFSSNLKQEMSQHNIPIPQGKAPETRIMETGEGLNPAQNSFAEHLVETEEYLLTPEAEEDRPMHKDQPDKQ